MTFERESDFEEAVIEVLKQNGWNDSGGVLKNPTEEDLIRNWAEILFANNKHRDRLNGVPLTDSEMAQILDKVQELRTPYALNAFINGKTVSIKRDNPDDPEHFGKEISLKIYDRQEIAAGDSRYQIAQQPRYPAHNRIRNDRRGDLCLLINGMPVIHIELKRSGVAVSQATNQIEKYSHEGVFTGIFQLVQVFVAMTPTELKYFANAGPDRFNPAYFFHWADVNNEPMCAGGDTTPHPWKRVTEKLLSIPMAHQLIGFYTVADATDGSLKVMRSYQYYAASAISNAVRNHDWKTPPLAGQSGHLGGYIWHTTGSGKTMTSFKSAQLIADSGDADKVVFLMDRIELGTQSLREYRAFADDAADIQGTRSTLELREKLLSSSPSEKLIVTSIQKMSKLKIDGDMLRQHDVEMLARKRIVFVVDEAHRSTFGEMLQTIKQTFPNALYFGFTGTPILTENKKKDTTTSMVFGSELHRYSIADGIRDGNVLGFDVYQVTTFKDAEVRKAVALEKAKASNVDEALADTRKKEVFYRYMNEVPMGPSQDELGRSQESIEGHLTQAQYGDDTAHKDMVVSDILDQFQVLSHGGKFHAILATSSIPEAITYYRKFKDQAPRLNVTALFDSSVDNSDGAIVKGDALEEIIEDYNSCYRKSFTIPTWALMKKDIAARLAHKTPYVTIDRDRDERIDLLIVVDQMLTGFDSKWVNTLYLDKIILFESIIQAFSRTNRVFGPDKPFGTVRYYRKPHTMKRNIEAAVKLYSGEKPLDIFVQKLPENIDLMNEQAAAIRSLFEVAGVADLSRLPDTEEERKMFAKMFIEFDRALEAARIQGFTWDTSTYEFIDDDERQVTRTVAIDERAYRIMVQRYKELFSAGGSADTSVPYDLAGHTIENDTERIDADYMELRFTKWLRALNSGDPNLGAIANELHRSFAALSQEDQRHAQTLIHDIEYGRAVVEEGQTLRDCINAYAKRTENAQVAQVVDGFGVDRSALEELLRLRLTENNLNEFGRFDELATTIDASRAIQFLSEHGSSYASVFRAKMRVRTLLKDFVLEGGFDLEERIRMEG
ncbi:HsdR family type I site-specific deoxyribonuclease [Trueperella bernardiae]|uniref:type I restriction endonuclease subunit R, EcoR124 family n=1 Tax=Trueperella bernardiae TaxID=59561 RepID=UPI002553F4F9|nr:HsdR family type I site-specific deoxyribonuclease [Trueperella bernardiae]WIM08122.1 HsdR family type I site-specific deoxyribonuclease [Trueperella bernardiae]